MRVVSWNMGGMTFELRSLETRRRAWEALVNLPEPADIALLQEASFPHEEWGIEPAVPLGSGRRAASRIWAPELELVDPQPLETAWPHGYV